MDTYAIPREGPEDEWKERIPSPERMARTLAAFSNGVGGRVWVGITDGGRIIGVPNLEAAKEEMLRARALVDPPPQLTMNQFPGPCELSLLRVAVAAGQDGPYCVVDANGKYTAYLRNRDATRPIGHKELGRLGQAVGRTALNEKDWRLMTILGQQDGLAMKDLARRACAGERSVRRTLVILQRAGLVTEVAGAGFALTPRGFKRWREHMTRRP